MFDSDRGVPPGAAPSGQRRGWLYVPPRNLVVLGLFLLGVAFMFAASGVAFAARELPAEKVLGVVVSATLATCAGLLTAAIAGGVAMAAAGRAIWGVAFCLWAMLVAVVAWVTVFASFGVKPVVIASFVVWVPIVAVLAAAAALLLGHIGSWFFGDVGRTALGAFAAWLGLDGASSKARWGRLAMLLLAAYLLVEGGLVVIFSGVR